MTAKTLILSDNICEYYCIFTFLRLLLVGGDICSPVVFYRKYLIHIMKLINFTFFILVTCLNLMIINR